MVREKSAKISSLAAVAIILALRLVDANGYDIGIYHQAPMSSRLLYPFFHASFLHAAINAWCLLTLAFAYNVSLRMMITALVIAVSFPVDTMYDILQVSCFLLPTIGLSGVCYALMGRMTFLVRRKMYYQTWIGFYLIIGFMLPNVNAWIHLYCYLAGVFVGFLNKPLR